MIRYQLRCAKGHEFEGWFQNSAAYDRQAKRGELECAVCGSSKVTKALMAPNVATRSKRRPQPVRREAGRPPSTGPEKAPKSEPQRLAAHQELVHLMRKLRAEIEAKSEYVGNRFCEEARKIHYEEVPARGIHGEATAEDAKALAEEGIEFFPLPILPEDQN
jgi:hypothetical protein